MRISYRTLGAIIMQMTQDQLDSDVAVQIHHGGDEFTAHPAILEIADANHADDFGTDFGEGDPVLICGLGEPLGIGERENNVCKVLKSFHNAPLAWEHRRLKGKPARQEYIRVEYSSPRNGKLSYAYLPALDCEVEAVEAVFDRLTGVDHAHIRHIDRDNLYGANGTVIGPQHASDD